MWCTYIKMIVGEQHVCSRTTSKTIKRTNIIIKAKVPILSNMVDIKNIRQVGDWRPGLPKAVGNDESSTALYVAGAPALRFHHNMCPLHVYVLYEQFYFLFVGFLAFNNIKFYPDRKCIVEEQNLNLCVF